MDAEAVAARIQAALGDPVATEALWEELADDPVNRCRPGGLEG